MPIKLDETKETKDKQLKLTKDFGLPNPVPQEPQLTLEEEFDNFIRKWCGNHAPHLLDTDENDGESFREKLRAKEEEQHDKE